MSDTVPTESDLTPRQREVLALIAKGATNPEIGEALGISLDGAKWHVSEIISRLGVASREEAADWWREQNGLRPRLASRRVAWFGLSWRAVAGAGAGVLVALVVVAALLGWQLGR